MYRHRQRYSRLARTALGAPPALRYDRKQPKLPYLGWWRVCIELFTPRKSSRPPTQSPYPCSWDSCESCDPGKSAAASPARCGVAGGGPRVWLCEVGWKPAISDLRQRFGSEARGMFTRVHVFCDTKNAGENALDFGDSHLTTQCCASVSYTHLTLPTKA